MRARGGNGDIDGARAEAQEHHKKVVQMSAAGQANHEKMCQLMDEAAKLRDEAQVCHEQHLTCKAAADSEHKKFEEILQKIKDMRDNLPD